MPKTGINDASTYNVSLSSRELALLAEWERQGRSYVTISEISEHVGPRAAPKVAQGLVRKRVLHRLRRGAYLVRPFRSLSRDTQGSSAVSVEALLHGEPHYLGGLWAWSFHGFSEQRYASVLDAFVTHRLAPRRLGAARVRFHVLPGQAFTYGLTTVRIEGLEVQLSDPERTLLDAFDHPRLSGRLGAALKLAHDRLGGLDPKRIVRYALLGSTPSTCQRVGALLARQGLPERALAGLRRKARQKRSLLSMDPEAPRTGPLNRSWNILENDR